MSTSRMSGTSALGIADNLLNTVLNSRLQRKAKSIILSSIEFLVVDFAILLTYLEYDIQNARVEFALRMTLYAGAIYVAFIALFLFVHSFLFLKVDNMQTTINVEKAYAKTNKIPFLDGILELPFPLIFRGKFWFFPYITWLVCGVVIGFSSFLFYVVREQLTMTAFATLVAGALLLYQITSDFSEYWVHSRNQEATTTSGNSSTASSSGMKSSRRTTKSDDDDDVEESFVVGKRETSSAGFTRI